jgi:hypothetical protein
MSSKLGGLSMWIYARLLIYVILMFTFAFVITTLPRYFSFSKSSFNKATGIGLFDVLFDKGTYGEFLTYRMLENFGDDSQVFANIYLPKANGETTEIDLLLVSKTGIYAFESKNYSGWIFGNDKNKYWTQTLPNKQKNRFFNPVWQNAGHISALKNVLGIDVDDVYKSYIVFSERCELKEIEVTSKNVFCLKRNNLMRVLKQDFNTSYKWLTNKSIKTISEILNDYTLASKEVKDAHIAAIQRKHGRN